MRRKLLLAVGLLGGLFALTVAAPSASAAIWVRPGVVVVRPRPVIVRPAPVFVRPAPVIVRPGPVFRGRVFIR
jgi:hypothetical protein